MKRTPARPRPTSECTTPLPLGSHDTAGRGQALAHGDARKSTTAKVSTAKAASALPPSAKSPLPVEKRKGKTSRPNTTAFPSPSKSAKGKEKTVRNKSSGYISDSDSSGASDDADDNTPAQVISNVHADSEGNMETSSGMGMRTQAIVKEEREITESACRKQLATLRSEDKRPPPPMTAATFASTFRLPNEGINSHKLKIGRDISKEEVEDVFGQEKSKNGFALAEKLTATQRKEAENLYCLCYQKPFAPTHVAKEFAIGFVLDKVQHKKVNWAEFAAETNVGQRNSYTRRLRGCVQRLASVLEVPEEEIYRDTGFSDYAEKSLGKISTGNALRHILEEGASKDNFQVPYSIVSTEGADSELIAARYSFPYCCRKLLFQCLVVVVD